MKPETPYPTINLEHTNLVSLPLAGQTAQLEFLGATDLNFSILPFTVREQALIYVQLAFSKSHMLLPGPGVGYTPRWSLVEEGGRIIVDRRVVTERVGSVLLEKVDVKINGTKQHTLTVHCPGSELRRVLRLFKLYYNPSLHLSVAHGGNPSRKPFKTLP